MEKLSEGHFYRNWVFSRFDDSRSFDKQGSAKEKMGEII